MNNNTKGESSFFTRIESYCLQNVIKAG